MNEQEKEKLAKRLLFEEFLEWFVEFPKEERENFYEHVSENNAMEETAKTNYYAIEQAKKYFEEIIWPSQKEEAMQRLEKLLKEREKAKKKEH